MSGLGGPVNGRLAFRYVATDTNTNGAYIGIDTISVDEASSATPEPSTVGMVLGGISLLAFGLRRNAARETRAADEIMPVVDTRSNTGLA